MPTPALPLTNLHITTVSGSPVLDGYMNNPGTGSLVITFLPHDPDSNPGCPHTVVKLYINGAAHPDDALTATVWSDCVGVDVTRTVTLDLSVVGSYPVYQVWHSDCGGCGYDGLIDISGGPPAVCAYGVETNPTATPYQLVTDAMIDVVVGAALAGTGNAEWIPYVETALAAIEGSIWLGVNCTTLPQGNSHLDLSDPATYTIPNLQAWFRYAAWSFFCRCKAAPGGGTPPTPPDAPTITPPTGGTQDKPVFVCDNTDLCTFLTDLKLEVEAVLEQIRRLRLDVTLIQRQHVPFGYISGAVHPGLTGNGSITVQAILAVSVQLTTPPYAEGQATGTPVAEFGVGYITSGTVAGWRQSRRLDHSPLWLDVAPDDTLIGYSLTPGAVATITEELREP